MVCRSLDCGSASLYLQPPVHVFGAHVSHVRSRCLTVAIDPAVPLDDNGSAPDFDRLNTGRRLPPHWLAFQLHRELELADDLSSVSVSNMTASLLAAPSGPAVLTVPSSPRPWPPSCVY